MLTVLCPSCACTTSLERPGDATACPRCGRPLDATDALESPEAAPEALDAADELLISDLREALGTTLSFERPAAESAARPDVLPANRRLGDFEIIAELGRGGMGIVYRARQLSLSRDVALKLLPGYARHGQRAVQRFRAEAQAAARIHHTNVVAIYAQGEHEGCYFYAMELIDGVGLDTVIRSRPELLSSAATRGSSSGLRLPSAAQRGGSSGAPATIEPAAVLSDRRGLPAGPPEPVRRTRADFRHLARLIAEVADGLECAHRQGVIHRDIKPHNLLLDSSGRLHLTDFGLARLVDEPHLTVTGEIMGTPAYLSPEQIRGGAVDHRTDVYSLGVTLYELLTRCKPFDGDTRDQIIRAILDCEPRPLRRIDPQIPADLETICLRAMDRDPARRHPTAALLAEDLRRFADGRPILSRRITPVERAVKWIRRHRAWSTAIAAGVLVIVLGGGLAASWSAGRAAEAERLLRHAYEQLTYFDYRKPELVNDEIERAAALGADPAELDIVRALAGIGADDLAPTIRHLETAVQRDPDDLRARYLLAWALRRARDDTAAAQALAAAERAGPPRSADVWLFRGLALQFDDPAEAVTSYRQANRLRAEQGGFFPQAVLHMARARNQLMYTTRMPDTFDEANRGLTQLIENGYYDSYPYYLLSIAHRLAAEIARSNREAPPDLAESHYDQALHWARAGQQAYPEDDRPYTAEAECLESLGDFDAALAARTRALELAGTESNRCSNYHYRWRLYYWTGALDAALGDLRALVACAPQNRCYAHFYPALVLADAGELGSARAAMRQRAENEPRSVVALIWAATGLRLMGAPEEARELLSRPADALEYERGCVPPQTADWMRLLHEHVREGNRLADLKAFAESTTMPRRLLSEAWFHEAALRLGAGDRDGARAALEEAYRCFDGEERYTYHARLLLVRMQENANWPAWIPVSSDGPVKKGTGTAGVAVGATVMAGWRGASFPVQQAAEESSQSSAVSHAVRGPVAPGREGE